MAKAHIGTAKNKKFFYDLDTLTRHAAVLGTTGSGKTVMCKVLVEEALIKGIPVIAIDPKGDIGGLGICDKDYNFSPFVKNPQKVAESHVENLIEHEVILSNSVKISKIKTTIFTPKSSVGIQVSLIPKLDAPDNFLERTKEDTTLIANFVDPISNSICILAGIKGSTKEKAQALMSSILVYNWNKSKNLTISSLMKQISNPPFEEIGSLDLEDFINEKERKKIVASLNLLLTSPTKQAWNFGEPLNINELFKKNSLSIFDLRHIDTEEKQFVVEQIMQEIYKFLIHKGGNEKLQYIFYIDELAGILPPPPSNPPSKKLLELLIRQARAFGLSIIVATQNPGDIDYKILGNIGTRFVGKLRTENDIEKVATAMDLSPSSLKVEISELKTGDFVYNNAIENKKEIIRARWLHSFHGGPLSNEEISWINSPHIRPEQSLIKINVDKLSSISKNKKRLIRRKKDQIKSSAQKILDGSEDDYEDDVLSELIETLRSKCDKFKVKKVISTRQIYVPHIKIVIEPKSYRGVKLPLQGPFVFDLTHKTILEGNYLKGLNWSQAKPKGIIVISPKRSINDAIYYSVSSAKQNLKRKFYSSDLIQVIDSDFEFVLKKNVEYLKGKLKEGKINNKSKKRSDEMPFRLIINRNNKKISEYKSKIRMHKAKRMVKRTFTNAKISKQTKEVDRWNKYIKDLKKDNEKQRTKIKKLKKDLKTRNIKLSEKAFKTAHSKITAFSYRPTNNDLIIHITLLLVPKGE